MVEGAVAVQVCPPGFEVAVKEVSAAPPVFVGGIQVTNTDSSPASTCTAVGAPGFVRGVYALETVLRVPYPAEL
jgi:hypothetical protein